jgi:hypothetical protein
MAEESGEKLNLLCWQTGIVVAFDSLSRNGIVVGRSAVSGIDSLWKSNVDFRGISSRGGCVMSRRALVRSCLVGIMCSGFVSPGLLGSESTISDETRMASLRRVSLTASINADHDDWWRGRIKSRSFPPGAGLPPRVHQRLYSQQVYIRRKHLYRRGARAAR